VIAGRRDFLKTLPAAVATLPVATAAGPTLETAEPALQRTWDAALRGLAGNVRTINSFPAPVLIEGGNYPGAWLECAPHESLVYAAWRPDVALATHRAFFHFQKSDGQLPAYIWKDKLGWGQIQMVVPIAATAYETYLLTRDRPFLEEAYRACTAWDAWLVKYRNTRRTGLCELFCEWDTGHDNSPRVAGLPQECPSGDARLCPPVSGLPRLAPDLSASIFGGRVALSRIASELKKPNEALHWSRQADAIGTALLEWLYDRHSACFYDLDARNQFVRIRGDAISRVLGERVVNQRLFHSIWHKQIYNPKAFWTRYPLPSIALDDPAFVRPIPPNSWGGAAQALTALRAPRWMDHYLCHSACVYLMRQWIEAITRRGEFLQQMDPQSGDFTGDQGSYSPAMLVLVDFLTRTRGVRPHQGNLEWNCSGEPGVFTRGAMKLAGEKRASEIWLRDKRRYVVRGQVRVLTDTEGEILALIGIANQVQGIIIETARGRSYRYTIHPDEHIVPA
jgi:hypothetical protein